MSRPRNGATPFQWLLLALATAGVVSSLAAPLSDKVSPRAAQRLRAHGSRGVTTIQTDAEKPPAGLTRDDWSQIRRAVRESEYHASRVAKPGEAPALQAPNRQQGYRTIFRREGIEIVPQAPRGRRGGWASR